MKDTLALPQLYKNSRLINTYAAARIVENYKQIYGMDVARYFEGIPQVELREEPVTGYKFFYPFNLDGDADFYKELQKIPWYYADWKWEFDVALGRIESGKKVLEIGCGKGAFLNKLKEKCECVGLELNDEAEKKEYNVTILNKTIEAFAATSPAEYDWVISFQVLEHIADIHSYISNSLKVLKPGGKMMIAVPNNQAKFFNVTDINFNDSEYQKALLLNMPPHHMGKWDLDVFKKLQDIYNLELVFHERQPVQSWRQDLNKALLLSGYNGIMKKVVRRMLGRARGYNLLAKLSPAYQFGDCILVVFRKK